MQHLTLQPAAGPDNLTFLVVGREFKKASKKCRLLCTVFIISSQLVKVWGLHGLLPWGSFVSRISLQFTMSIFPVVCALGVDNTL